MESSMKSQIDMSIRKTLEYAARYNFEISDEKAFSVYFAYFYFEKLRGENKSPIFEFERGVFKEANFPEFFTNKERLDLLSVMGGKKVGFEFKYPKKTDTNSTAKRAEIYHTIGRLVHLTNKRLLDKGFLICATNMEAIYNGRKSNEYPTYENYFIPENSYILPSEEPNGIVKKSKNYAKIWNCIIHNEIRFDWQIIRDSTYRYLNPIEICNVI